MTTLFHYTNAKFDAFDSSKCDGIWLTTISPVDEDMLNEIGAAGFGAVAVVEIDEESLEVIYNGDNYDVEEQLECENANCIINQYEGFEDYAFADASLLNIKEWIEG